MGVPDRRASSDRESKETFHEAGDQSAVYHQPSNEAERPLCFYSDSRVNVAGIHLVGAIADMDDETFDKVFGLNAIALSYSRLSLPQLPELSQDRNNKY